jgi:hypothetical protein
MAWVRLIESNWLSWWGWNRFRTQPDRKEIARAREAENRYRKPGWVTHRAEHIIVDETSQRWMQVWGWEYCHERHRPISSACARLNHLAERSAETEKTNVIRCSEVDSDMTQGMCTIEICMASGDHCFDRIVLTFDLKCIRQGIVV